MFLQHYAFVFLYTSFICMVVEVGAPRGTDNFFLQTVCMAVLLFQFKSITGEITGEPVTV